MELDNGPISQATIDAIKSILSNGGQPVMPGDVRKDISVSTGLTAYNLEPAARLLVPVITPLRNRIPRIGNTRGGTAANWKVITSIDINKAAVFTAEGTKASTVSYSVSDRAATYKTISAGDNVTFQAIWAGKTFEDVKARSVGRLLKHVLIREEQAQIGGRNAAFAAVTAPTVSSATSGGSIADGTYNVYCRAIVPMAGSGLTAIGRFSAATSSGALSGGAGNAHTISASVPWVEGASRYEWYVGTAAAERLEATTYINSVKLTALAGTGATYAAVNALGQTGANSLAFDGILTQVTPSLSIVKTLATGTAGTGTQLALSDLDDVLQDMWDTYRADPSDMFVNSEQSRKITDLVLAASGAPTLYVNSGSAKAELTGGYRVTSYVNKATGRLITINTHPYMDQGTILFASFEMPFPASDIDNPVEIETRQEYMQLDYPLTSPKHEFEILLDEALKVYFPGAFGVVRNVAPIV